MSEQNTLPASVAMLRVLEAWGVKHIYGYPGGSINSTMAALAKEKERLQYIQIRQEQVGAFAASAEAKLTGKIGVAFGSAGPGATNLLTGLYDAREDHAPVLAIVGQAPSTVMNYNFFQELNEGPIFDDVSVYNRTVMTPESLPHVVDQAIREAYQHKGVAVVIIPNDFGYKEIPEENYASFSQTDNKPKPEPVATDKEVEEFLAMVQKAKRPVIHVGRGIKDGGDELVKLSKKLQIPLVMTGLAKDKIPDSYEGNVGIANRAASKAADEIMAATDLLITIGADFPFANLTYQTHPFQFVQIDNQQVELGRHHNVDLAIWSDATRFVKKALEKALELPERPFFRAAVADMKNWKAYEEKLMNQASDPLQFESLYKEINAVADEDAAFAIDVGDNIINSFRYLNLTPKNKWVISALFASMGTGLPGALAAQLNYPKRQVFNIAGDGALSMVMHDLVTEVKYKLPIINIVTANNTLNFIKSEQDDAPMAHSGIDLHPIDFATVARGMGMEAATVTKSADLKDAFKQALAAQKAGKPFLIDAKITAKRGIPVEELLIKHDNGEWTESIAPDYDQNSDDKPVASVREFFDRYQGEDLKTLPEIFAEYGVAAD